VKILCIAAYAPPLNHAEPIQVGRYLGELLKADSVRLVSEQATGSWSKADPALGVAHDQLSHRQLALPLHDIAGRFLGHRSMKRFRDRLERWPLLFAPSIVRWAKPFDIIYSRSLPTRSALLAARVKQLSGRPWVMHLSDPWAETSYGDHSIAERRRMQRDEARCVEQADLVTFTTEPMADYYRKKYPNAAGKIRVSPNVFDCGTMRRENPPRSEHGKFRLVYTGALYGERTLAPLLSAIAALDPLDQNKIEVIVAGNAVDEAVDEMRKIVPLSVRYLGPIGFREAKSLQESADLLVTLEPPARGPLDGTYMQSKILDYLPTGRPILALTPAGSVAARLIDGRYGWAVEPDDIPTLTKLLQSLAGEPSAFNSFTSGLPEELTVEFAAARLRAWMAVLAGQR